MDFCERETDIPLAWKYRRVDAARRHAIDSALSGLGVREFGAPLVLILLDSERMNGEATQKELAVLLDVTPPTITCTLKSLEKRECIVRHTNKRDLRCKTIRITDRGREVARKCKQAFDYVDETTYAGFTKEEIEIMDGFYDRILSNLRSIGCSKEVRDE